MCHLIFWSDCVVVEQMCMKRSVIPCMVTFHHCCSLIHNVPFFFSRGRGEEWGGLPGKDQADRASYVCDDLHDAGQRARSGDHEPLHWGHRHHHPCQGVSYLCRVASIVCCVCRFELLLRHFPTHLSTTCFLSLVWTMLFTLIAFLFDSQRLVGCEDGTKGCDAERRERAAGDARPSRAGAGGCRRRRSWGCVKVSIFGWFVREV